MAVVKQGIESIETHRRKRKEKINNKKQQKHIHRKKTSQHI